MNNLCPLCKYNFNKKLTTQIKCPNCKEMLRVFIGKVYLKSELDARLLREREMITTNQIALLVQHEQWIPPGCTVVLASDMITELRLGEGTDDEKAEYVEWSEYFNDQYKAGQSIDQIIVNANKKVKKPDLGCGIFGISLGVAVISLFYCTYNF